MAGVAPASVTSPPMGQPVAVVEKPSSIPGMVRFEANRSLTGMGHERFGSRAEAVGQPLIAATFPIPKIALLPLLILWLGIGEPSKIAVIALGVFFPMAINTYAGVRQADPLLVRAAIAFGAGRWSVIRKVILPSALPMIFAGLKLGAGTALLLLVAAEMIAADSGIGFLVLHAGNIMDTTKLMVGIVCLSLLGVLSHWLLTRGERLAVPWRHT